MDNEVSYIIKYNNGKIKRELFFDVNNVNKYSSERFIFRLESAFQGLADIISMFRKYNGLVVHLSFGIMYSPKDYINGKIKDGATPIDEIVAVNSGKCMVY